MIALVTAGTGTVAPSATRSSPAHWVESGGTRLLMDCGAGTAHALARCGLPWDRLTHLALTHFHPDHFGEVPALLFALRHTAVPPRTAPLVVLGPPGTADLLHRLRAGFGDWVTAPGYPLVLHDVADGEPFVLGPDLVLETVPVPHTAESVALAVRTPRERLVYTGDTGPSEDLAAWAHGCDLLLAECSLPDAMAMDIHLTPRQAGTLAARAEAKRLVLTHFYPPVERVDVLAQVAEHYGGPAVLAHDGGRYEIG